MPAFWTGSFGLVSVGNFAREGSTPDKAAPGCSWLLSSSQKRPGTYKYSIQKNNPLCSQSSCALEAKPSMGFACERGPRASRPAGGASINTDTLHHFTTSVTRTPARQPGRRRPRQHCPIRNDPRAVGGRFLNAGPGRHMHTELKPGVGMRKSSRFPLMLRRSFRTLASARWKVGGWQLRSFLVDSPLQPASFLSSEMTRARYYEVRRSQGSLFPDPTMHASITPIPLAIPSPVTRRAMHAIFGAVRT